MENRPLPWTVFGKNPSPHFEFMGRIYDMDYSILAGQSSVDMLRFRLRFSGEPGKALDWFTLLHADLVIEFDRRRDNHGHPIVRYPLSLRVGTYREMMKIPVADTSIVIGLGKIGKELDYKTGFLEFNPAKTYPSEQLEFIYRRISSTPEISLELVRWDFATDYQIARDELSLMRDKRHYTFVVSNGVTEYLGTRNKNGFVKLYDKKRELEAKGIECGNPKTRLEITIEEDGKKRDTRLNGKLIPDNEWPRIVLVPKKIDDETQPLAYALMLEAWMHGVPLEKLLVHVSDRTRSRYRKRITEECGAIPPSTDFEECRNNAFAWETHYGGTVDEKAVQG